MSLRDVRGRSRSKIAVAVRSVFVHLAYFNYGVSLSNIGAILGNRDRKAIALYLRENGVGGISDSRD